MPRVASLLHMRDAEVLHSVCRILCGLAAQVTTKVIASGVVPRLVQLLGHSSANVQCMALRTICNLVAGNETERQAVLDWNVLRMLLPLLEHVSVTIQQHTCRTLFNITSGSRAQISRVIEAGFMWPLSMALSRGNPEVQPDALYALCNVVIRGTDTQIHHVVAEGAIPNLCAMLRCEDIKVLGILVQGTIKTATTLRVTNETLSSRNVFPVCA